MCGDVGRGVWLHAGGIGKTDIIPVIGRPLRMTVGVCIFRYRRRLPP